MTDPRQAERERQARECIRDTEEVWNRVCHIDDETHTALVRNITKLIKATEAATLEEAAGIEDLHEKDFGHRQLCGVEAEIRDWLLTQAEERRS